MDHSIPMTIRNARHGDHGAVDALLQTAYPALLGADYDAAMLRLALPIIACAQMRLLTSGSYYVACAPDGALLAAGGWTWTAPQGGLGPPDMAHVRHVVTDHRHVRRGIGGALMRHVIDGARGAGVGRLDCLSTLTAVPFYSAMGFCVVGPVEIRLAPGTLFPAVQMRRNLAP